MIDTGDRVFHRPSRETWIVAYVRDGRLCACGWPESLVPLADCLLVDKATRADRLSLLGAMATGHGADSRTRYARDALDATQAKATQGGCDEQ